MAIWARDHSVPTPNKICPEDLIQRLRTLVQVSAIGTTIASDCPSSNPILDLSLLNFQTPTTTAVDTIQYPLSFTALFPPASTPFCDSSFPNSVSQNGIPNGIPLLVHNALCPMSARYLCIQKRNSQSYRFLHLLHCTNLEVSLALVFHLAPRGFPSEVHLSFISL